MTLGNRECYDEEYLEAFRRQHRSQAVRRRREVERGARREGTRRRRLELEAEIASCRQELALRRGRWRWSSGATARGSGTSAMRVISHTPTGGEGDAVNIAAPPLLRRGDHHPMNLPPPR